MNVFCLRQVLFWISAKTSRDSNSVTDLDSNEDKLNWIFMAFDQDGGGFIDIKESFSQGAIYNFIWSSDKSIFT